MKWANLSKSLCPNDGQPLRQDALSRMIQCSRCSFKITEARLEEILRGHSPDRPRTVQNEEERLSELNNLGRKPFRPYEY